MSMRYQRGPGNGTDHGSDVESWLAILQDCQRKIAASSSGHMYCPVYLEQETCYWWHIPKWIYEDRDAHRVRSALDIGCAYGTLSLYCRLLLQCETYSTDIMPIYMTEMLTHQHGIKFKVSNVEFEPLPWPGPFDLVILTEVLEHFNCHPVPTLKKIGNAMGPDSRLYLSTPDAAEWGRVTERYGSIDEMPSPDPSRWEADVHTYVYTEAELLSVLTVAGFQILRLDYAPGVGKRHFNLTLAKA